MEPISMTTCRCGWDGQGEHPCHADEYTCRRPARRRFYGARPVALAGVQFKLQASDTWACDEHWAAFSAAEQPDKMNGGAG